jgi:hypothetical protein
MLLGNAAAPRWYELNDARLGQYLGFLTSVGATSTELVLHHGEMDARGRRVHLLEPDWIPISKRFQNAGFACQLHVSLDPRFALARWETDRAGLQVDHRAIIAAAIAIGERQSSPVAFVVHATSSSLDRTRDGITEAKGYLEWAGGLLAGAEANVILCPELRPARDRADRRWDRSRASIASVVGSLAHPKIGICWDLGHDWENRDKEDGWSPTPSDAFLKWVRHVHLHDAGANGALHHPLGSNRVPWAEQLRLLSGRGYDRALTMEIRYRYALAAGEPWTVLASSYRRALEQLS